MNKQTQGNLAGIDDWMPTPVQSKKECLYFDKVEARDFRNRQPYGTCSTDGLILLLGFLPLHLIPLPGLGTSLSCDWSGRYVFLHRRLVVGTCLEFY